MAELTVYSMVLDTTGVDVEEASANFQAVAAGGDYITNTANGPLYIVVNTSSSATTVTIASQKACDQGSTHNIALAVGANEVRMVGPIGASRFNDSNGRVQLTYSTDTGVEVMPIRG